MRGVTPNQLVALRGRCGGQSASRNRSFRGGVKRKNDTPPKSSAAAGYFRSWLTHPPQVKIKQHRQTQLETGVHRRGGPIFGSFQFGTLHRQVSISEASKSKGGGGPIQGESEGRPTKQARTNKQGTQMQEEPGSKPQRPQTRNSPRNLLGDESRRGGKLGNIILSRPTTWSNYLGFANRLLELHIAGTERVMSLFVFGLPLNTAVDVTHSF